MQWRYGKETTKTPKVGNTLHVFVNTLREKSSNDLVGRLKRECVAGCCSSSPLPLWLEFDKQILLSTCIKNEDQGLIWTRSLVRGFY